MTQLFAEFVKEAHRHPLFTLFLTVVLTGWIVFSVNQFAYASEVEELRTEFRDISATVKRSALETRVHSIEAEVFQLERLIAEERARDIDYDRLARLRSELGTAKRQLRRVDTEVTP